MKKWILALALGVAVTEGWADSTIEGTVTGPGGAPLGSIEVEARIFNGDWWEYVDSVTTDWSGHYSLGGLPAGDYRMFFDDWSGTYIPEWYDNALDEDSATTVVVGENATISGIDARLARGSKITGTVTNSAGVPLDGIEVRAYRYNGSWWESTGSAGYTDMDGHYSVGGLSGGKYRLRFRRWEGDYALEWYKDAYSVEAATSIPVPPLSTVSNINAMLGPAATITGKITGPGGTPPLEDIDVSLYRWTNDYWESIDGIYAYSDSNGVYAVGGLPAGTYAVQFRDWQDIYAPMWFSNVQNEAQATSIVLAAGATRSNVNAALALAARISGTVTGTNGTTPVASASVTAYRWTGSDWDWSESEQTDGSGFYQLAGLAAGQYRLEFRDQQGLYQTKWYNNAANRDDASNVVVAAGGSVSNVNASLALGAHIAGTVTELDGTTPIAEVYVWAYRQNGSEWDWTGSDRTDSAGKYDVGGLPTGSYRIEFWTDDRYVTEYYNDKTNWGAADAVVVSTITTVSNVNASLAPAPATGGSRITGTVTGPGGTPPLQDILVNLYVRTGADWIYDQTVATAADGTYAFRDLEASTNLIQFMDADDVYADEWYDDAASLAEAASIVVTNLQQVAGINAALADIPQTGISGTVTETGSGLPVAGITVELYADFGLFWGYVDETTTGPDGAYRFAGLAPGIYRLGFFDWDGSAYYLEYYADAYDVDLANDVAVFDGQMTSGIDAVLDPIVQTGISGTVTAADGGAPLGDIQVRLFEDYGSGWEWTSVANTRPNGTYAFAGLPAGTYRIGFVDEAAEYRTEYYDDQADLDAAADIEVIDGQMTGGIDAALTRNPPAVPPVIVGLKQQTAGNWEILFTGGADRNCILQHSYVLSLTNQWVDIGDPIVGGSGTNVLACPESAPGCFWRVRVQP